MSSFEDSRRDDALIAAVRGLVRKTLVPLEQQLENEDAVPDAAITAMRELGLFGLSTPREYGGSDISVVTEVEVVMELGWAAAAFRSFVGINLGVGSQGIVRRGTEDQKRRWLPVIASGEVIASFALSEAEAGSDATAITSSAVKDGSEYVLNGSKKYVTNSSFAGIATVIARTHGQKLPGNAHLSAFLVPLTADGITISPRRSMLGLRGGYWADVDFSAVRVPQSALLGGEGDGFSIMMSLLDRSRLQVSAVSVGQARRLLEECLAHATSRQQFGQPIVRFQLIQAMLADSYAELHAMEAMVREAARRFDAGEEISTPVAATKMFATEALGRIADRAVQIFGATGLERGSVVERMYRDVRSTRFIEGSTQMLQINIARALAKTRQPGMTTKRRETNVV